MKTGLKKMVVVVGMCVVALIFTNQLSADEADDAVEELIAAGITNDVMEELLKESEDTLGQRAQDMLDNGTITERQYEKIYKSIIDLPEARRQKIKNAYDKGYADKLYDAVTGVAHRKLDEGSLGGHIKDLKQEGLSREQIKETLLNEGVTLDHLKDLGYGPGGASRPDHIKDLREQGLSREEIAERLQKEGVSIEHLKDLGYGPEGSRIDHAKDIRATDSEEAQHKVDRAHEKRRDKKGLANRVDHIKDKENLPGRAKDSRDVRKKERRKNEAHKARGKDAGGARAKARRGR